MTIEAIQPFELFSDKKTKVFFRAPSVADYRNFVGLDESLEEMITTQYLNNLQIPDKYPDNKPLDSANWTAEDRRTALYWVYINTRSSTVITQEYHCQHCSKKHGRQIDLLELGEYFIDTKHSMVERLDVPNVKAGFIKPLRGYAMEHIEQLRNLRDELEEDTAKWCVAHADMRLYETAWAVSFKDDDKDLTNEEQATNRYEYLLTLDAEKAFKPLMAQVRQALGDMRHGLMSEYHDGVIKLVTPPHECPNTQEGDEKKQTILLLPFLYNEFFPTL
jgi:hypothetical protein